LVREEVGGNHPVLQKKQLRLGVGIIVRHHGKVKQTAAKYFEEVPIVGHVGECKSRTN
jgi:hypothetical protein